MTRPTDRAILLVLALSGRDELCADEIRGGLARLGFEVTAQQVAAWLRRMGREDMACVEAAERRGYREYRLTRFGWTQLGNWMPVIWRLQTTGWRTFTLDFGGSQPLQPQEA